MKREAAPPEEPREESAKRSANSAGPVDCPLYECGRCQRLFEKQVIRDEVVVPSFCPWSGTRLSGILGREIDGYRIDRVLAEGGFGIVFLASNLAEPTIKGVVKILRPRLAHEQPRFVKLFVEEARLTEAIGRDQRENIVKVWNVREHPWPYFFMEYIRGVTLDKFVEENSGKIPIDDCIGYMWGIVAALKATHARGRVHRDLKPVNIMVSKTKAIGRLRKKKAMEEAEKRIKMLDFGLALQVAIDEFHIEEDVEEEPTGSRQTPRQLTGVVGTPEYMPPEAFEGQADFAGDIYSFGVTAYEILSGRRPWDDPLPHTDRLGYWKRCHQEEPPLPIREARPDVPKRLARAVMACLEKDPGKRVLAATGIRENEPEKHHRLAEGLRERLEPHPPNWIKFAFVAASLALVLLCWRAFFSIDKGVKLEVQDPGQPIFADGKAFFCLRAKEEVSGIRVRLCVKEKGDTTVNKFDVEFELYENKYEPDPTGLTLHNDSSELSGFWREPALLEAGKKYLLAVRVADQNGELVKELEKELELEKALLYLEAEDTAGSLLFEAPLTLPAPISVIGIKLSFSDKDEAAGIDLREDRHPWFLCRGDLFGRDLFGTDCERPPDTISEAIPEAKLTLDLNQDTKHVHKARCDIEGDSPPPRRARTKVVFEKLNLTANKTNVLQIGLTDALNRRINIVREVHPDTQVPELTEEDIVLRSNGSENPQCHKVKKAEEITLEVTCGDAENVKARVLDHEEDLTKLDSGVWNLENLGGFDLREGKHRLWVTATDRADHSTRCYFDFVINTRSPTVEVLNAKKLKEADKPDFLDIRATNSLKIRATDLNGIDRDTFRVSFVSESDGKGVEGPEVRTQTIESDHEKATVVDFTVDLSPLREHDRGTVELTVADGCGGPRKEKYRFEFDRQSSWKERVVEFQGMTWIKLAEDESRVLYISRTEISNGQFRRFAGELTDQGLPLPLFWEDGQGGEDFKGRSVDPYPVVGISPEVAQEFAKRLHFGARLLTEDEFAMAVEWHKRGFKYPWGDNEKEGRLWCNCRDTRDKDEWTLKGDCATLVGKEGESIPLAKVDAEPFCRDVPDPPAWCRILHLIGNAAELVTSQNDFKLAGGAFEDSYDQCALTRAWSKYVPHYTVGFRLVIEIEFDHKVGDDSKEAEFRSKATEEP